MESQIVALDGRDLSQQDILKRLKKETPVLVAIDGRMVDRFYLQIVKADTLIILLSEWDGSPATKLLPAPNAKPAQGAQPKKRQMTGRTKR